MSVENPVKNTFNSRVNGFFASALGMDGEHKAGIFITVRNIIMASAMTGAVITFGIDEYLDIGIKKQELDAARLDSQSVLTTNNITPQQASDWLAKGKTIKDANGNVLVGKSLGAFVAYLSAQAEAKTNIAKSEYATVQTQMEIWARCWEAITKSGVPTGCGSHPAPYLYGSSVY